MKKLYIIIVKSQTQKDFGNKNGQSFNRSFQYGTTLASHVTSLRFESAFTGMEIRNFISNRVVLRIKP